MALRLLIADDERLFRESLRVLLETGTDIKVVAEAGDGQEAVVQARALQPDIVLLDVHMPKMNGIEAAKLIVSVAPQTKILMLSVHRDDEKISSAISAGATGYILKDTDRKDFIDIIKSTHAGKAHTSPYLARPQINHSSRHEDLGPEEIRRKIREKYGLTDHELEILCLLTEGLNNEEISQAMRLARETVKGHLKTLFPKLKVKNRTEAAVLAVREGLE